MLGFDRNIPQKMHKNVFDTIPKRVLFCSAVSKLYNCEQSGQWENEDRHAISDAPRPSESEVLTTSTSWSFGKVGLTGVCVGGLLDN